MPILIIEDDPVMFRSIDILLDDAGLACTTIATGEGGIEQAQERRYDAILLDLTLPDLEGHEVFRHLRAARVMTPVLVLSGNSELASKVLSFGLGADDYATKPFQRAELLARIHALVRRSAGQASPIVNTGTMAVNLAERTVEISGHPVHMTVKEYAILEMLTLRKGLTMTKEMIIDHLYSGRDEPDLKIIDVFICKMRNKLAEAGAGTSGYIETVWGQGYALRDPERVLQTMTEAA